MVIKADSGDSILFKAAVSNRLNEGGFACILKADDGYLELFVEESGLDPSKYFIYEGKHFLLVSLYWQKNLKLIIINANILKSVYFISYIYEVNQYN